MKESDSRLALVTGASSGIGAAIAAALLRDRWTVIGLSRRRAGFDDPLYRDVPVDLGDLRRLREVADRDLAPVLGEARWQRVGLVNNAAVVGAMRPVEDLDPLELSRAFAVNAVAPVFLMGVVIRHVAAGVALRIVNLSTAAAVQGFPGLVDYGGSKAALRLASMAVAAELTSSERPGGPRPDTTIVSYSPGVVDTPMQEAARSPGRPWNQLFVDMHAQGQLVPPGAPAADVVRFLSAEGGTPFAESRLGMA